MQGLFITMEGCEGAGKSLQCKMLSQYLQGLGYNTLLTREPGGTKISEQIRGILLDPVNKNMSPATEALLYSAARAQHIFEAIKPALEKGFFVISDRFTDSSIVYQGFARKLGYENIKNINAFATNGLEPDITFFIDISPESSLTRKQSDAALDRIELENIKFHMDVYEGYKKLAKQNPGRVMTINGSRSPDEIHKDILNIIKERLLINE